MWCSFLASNQTAVLVRAEKPFLRAASSSSAAALKFRPVPRLPCSYAWTWLADPTLMRWLSLRVPHRYDFPKTHWTVSWPQLLSPDLLCSSFLAAMDCTCWGPCCVPALLRRLLPASSSVEQPVPAACWLMVSKAAVGRLQEKEIMTAQKLSVLEVMSRKKTKPKPLGDFFIGLKSR